MSVVLEKRTAEQAQFLLKSHNVQLEAWPLERNQDKTHQAAKRTAETTKAGEHSARGLVSKFRTSAKDIQHTLVGVLLKKALIAFADLSVFLTVQMAQYLVSSNPNPDLVPS